MAATQNAPGQVLRRPLGSKGANAEIPKVKGISKAGPKVKARKADPKALRAVLGKLEQAEVRHRKRHTTLEKARDAIQARADREEREWRRENEKLERFISG